jgi:hypothetical protein
MNRSNSKIRHGLVFLLTSLLTAPGLLAQDLHNGLYLPANDVPILTSDGAEVLLNGNVVFAAPDFDVEVELNANDFPIGALASVDLRGAFSVEVSADGTGSFSRAVLAPPVVLASLPIAAGVDVIPVLALVFRISGEAEGGMKISAVSQFTASYSVGIGSTPDSTLLQPPLFDSQVGPPEVSGSTNVDLILEIETRMVFLISWGGIILGGPMVSTAADLHLSVTPTADPWWTLEFGASASAGATFLGLVAIAPLWDTAESLDDAGGPFPLDLTTTRWSTVYELAEATGGTSVTPLGDDLAVVGTGNDSNGQGWFLRLDPEGEIDWQQRTLVQPFGLNTPKEVQSTADGGLVVGCIEGSNGKARIERLDGDGAWLWSEDYDDDLDGLLQLESLIVRDDGGLVFAGSVSRTGIQHPVVVWLDDQGVVEDAIELDFGVDSDTGIFRQVIPTADGGWVAAGSTIYEDHPDILQRTLDGRNGLVARFDANRQLQFASVCGGIGGDALHAVTELQDGTLLAAGYVSTEAHRSWLLAVDPSNGSILWSATYAGDTENGTDEFHSIAALPDTCFTPPQPGMTPGTCGGAIVAGTTSHGADQDSWMIRVDGGGMPVWFKSLRGPHADKLVDLRALSDGVVACGHTQSLDPLAPFPLQQLWVVRTSVDGMLHFQSANGFDAVNDQARWQATAAVVQQAMPCTPVTLALTEDDAILDFEITNAILTDL